MVQARGNQIYSRLDLLSYLLWIPALVGIFAFLRERTPGRAHIGGAFAALALAGFAVTSVMTASMISMAQGPAVEGLKERLATLDTVSSSFVMTAVHLLAIANLLWGLALMSQAGLNKITGYLFLAQTALIVLADVGFAAQQDPLFNIGVMFMNLAMFATYATAGMFLWRASQEEPAATPTAREKGRSASATA